MSTTRGRVSQAQTLYQPGQQSVGGQNPPVRGMPASAGGPSFGAGRPFIDPSSPFFWRLVFAGLAGAYIFGFHVTLGRLARVSVGR